MHKAKHSKFKNTGILFELLTRQITADIIGGKDESAAKQILFKYFSENTESTIQFPTKRKGEGRITRGKNHQCGTRIPVTTRR